MAAGKTYKGKNLRVRIGGKTVFHATECSFTTSRNMDSIASKDTNGEEVSPGNYTWGLSTNFLMADKPDASTTQLGIKDLLDAYQAGDVLDVEFTTDELGDVVISGEVYIESLDLTAPTNGVATGSTSLKGSGDFVTELVAA